MTKHILTFLFTLLPLFALAQKTKTEFYDSHWLRSSEKNAAYYRQYTRADGGYDLTEHAIDSTLLTTGHISSIRYGYASNLRNGFFTYYTRTGHKVSRGTYIDGVQQGIWQYYHSGTDTLQTEKEYSAGVVWKSKSYYLHTGQLQSESQYQAGSPVSTMLYDYYPGGQLQRICQQLRDTTLCLHEYTRSGADTTCTIVKDKIYQFVEQMPAPRYDMMAYLSKNIQYPPSARRKGKQGRVAIQFVVNEDGSISDVIVVTSVYPDIDAEAVRVISTMPPWRPGKQNGKPVRVMYTQPITFTLG